MGLCSGHENSVVIRELSLYPQSLFAKLTVLDCVDCTGADPFFRNIMLIPQQSPAFEWALSAASNFLYAHQNLGCCLFRGETL